MLPAGGGGAGRPEAPVGEAVGAGLGQEERLSGVYIAKG